MMRRRIAIQLFICYLIDLIIFYVPAWFLPDWIFRILYYANIEHLLGEWNKRIYYIFYNAYFFLFSITLIHGILLLLHIKGNFRKRVIQYLIITPVLYITFVLCSGLFLSLYFKIMHQEFNLFSGLLNIFLKGVRYSFAMMLLSPFTYVVIAVHTAVYSFFLRDSKMQAGMR